MTLTLLGTRLGTVTPITAAPSYPVHLANESSWCDFTVTCFDAKAAAGLASELYAMGVESRVRDAAVTVRYDSSAPIVKDVPTNVAMVAMCHDYADADDLIRSLATYEETTITADVFVLV